MRKCVSPNTSSYCTPRMVCARTPPPEGGRKEDRGRREERGRGEEGREGEERQEAKCMCEVRCEVCAFLKGPLTCLNYFDML